MILETTGSFFRVVSFFSLEMNYDFGTVQSYGDSVRAGCVHPSGAYKHPRNLTWLCHVIQMVIPKGL